MQLSAEVRWFFKASDEALNSATERWFSEGEAPGGGGERTDEYVILSGDEKLEVGLKRRGAKPGLEVKGLVARLSPIPGYGPVELWSKWSLTSLAVSGLPTVSTVKTRWLRKLDFDGVEAREVALGKDEKPLGGGWPRKGCNVERTRVVAGGGEPWWTIGLEAFGPLAELDGILQRSVKLLALPDLSRALPRSYPGWLAELTSPHS